MQVFQAPRLLKSRRSFRESSAAQTSEDATPCMRWTCDLEGKKTNVTIA